ncbi:hexose transporter [Gloeophyllum trabeum ATCC 11539]|uniref:Hexose transporter n=1 Tax=Gloeophyllum trabeum (strain ATCC 11539 / FP-39264 / Madison 617) TaxID=670483 RepID=S7PX93_GLOTA|nr:hexose transporter [Gloeophyllum trabeum ATCC 11539]EPQ52118.1 hexose transporter [Gloeophyllum trabeum ATCC 11539]
MVGGAVAVNGADTAMSRLIDPNRKWYNNKRLLALNGWIVLLLITSSTNGYDGSMMNGLQSLPQWANYFGNPTGGKLGLLNAIQNIGSLAGYPFAPYVSDGIGRRGAIFLGAAIMCIAVAIQTAAYSVGMFIGARFMIGFGLTFAANAAPMLVSEVSYPTYRAPLTSLYNSLWYSGAIIAAWSTYGTFKIPSTWAWRLPSLLQGIPSILQVFLIWFVPESPRWLVSKGKDAQALQTLAYYHADGNDQDPLVQYEYEEIRAAIEFDRTVAANVGWKSFLTTPGNRKRVRIIVAIAFFSQWSGNGLVSYYLNKVFDTIGITDPTTQLLINGILQIWNLFWACGASFMVDRAGRRMLFLTSAGGMLLFWTVQTICVALFAEHRSPDAAHSVIAFIFLYYAVYDLAFTPLIVSYTVEILPFALRAKGFNIFNFTISCALIFNQYINPIALDALQWKYYIVYVCWIAFEFVFLYFFVVETKNLTLEETAALFDGAEAAAEVAHAGATEVREDASEKGSHGGYSPQAELKA